MKKNLMYGSAKNVLQKTYKMSVESDGMNVDFFGENRQFVWLEISLVWKQE